VKKRFVGPERNPARANALRQLHGKLGRSEGCFAMSRENQYKVMRKLAGGRMIYADKLA